MRILAVPNWSFHDPKLCSVGVRAASESVFVHYAQGDVDHGRTVTAFSGEAADVFRTMDALCEQFLPELNLGEGGVHPFAGALDVAPFVLLEGSEAELILATRAWASAFSRRYCIPVHLYEKASYSGNESRLPMLRGQLGPVDKPFDYGSETNLRWGYSVVGVRDFLLAVNLNFPATSIVDVRILAREIRTLRDAGESGFTGVRALAFHLKKQQLAQLSLNLTLLDRTSADSICNWVNARLGESFSTELIGVIRDIDLPKSTCLTPARNQIVPTL